MLTSSSGLALYLHVPFCVRKCAYCDFLSVGACSEGVVESYLQGVAREIGLWEAALKERRIISVFIGGGTPTALPPGKLERLLRLVSGLVGECREFTIEVNPGTVDRRKAEIMREFGVNRISLGVQSFADHILKQIGRIHTAVQAKEAFSLLRQAGFGSINVDLMFSLPGQSLAEWENTLMEAVRLRPEHISAYSLILEEGTPLWDMVNGGTVVLPGEDTDYEMYQLARQQLTNNGYIHYEISNFARPDFKSIHNQVYWRNEEFLGLGPGAASFIADKRMENESELVEYCRRVERGQIPVSSVRFLTQDDIMDETMMMGLRLLDGVTYRRFQERFGQDIRHIYSLQLEKLYDSGLIIVDDVGVRLSDKGIPLANVVFREFLR